MSRAGRDITTSLRRDAVPSVVAMDTRTAPARDVRRRVPWSTDLAVVAAAVVTALVDWLFVARLADVDLAVRQGDTVRHVGGAAVAVTAGLAALAAVGLVRVLERRSATALRTWTVVAVVVFAVSLLGPLGAETRAAGGALLSLHAVVATVVIGAVLRSRS